jgi:hypothetical protein
MKYLSVLCSVIWDVVKDEISCLIVDFDIKRVKIHNYLLRFRRRPKQKPFNESDPYFEPYKNDNA